MANPKCEQHETPIDMLPDEVLNMIFNRLNFHGHLRLSGVCIRWKNLVQNDALFMNTVRFNAGKMSENHTLVRSYKHVDLSHDPWNICFGESLQELLKTAETILFGTTKRAIVNLVMPLCKSLKEVALVNLINSHDHDDTELTFNHPLPVRIATTACTEFLDRFDVITNISQLSLDDVPTDEQMAKYGGVIKSFSIDFEALLNGCDRLRNLQLQHLRLTGYVGYEIEQATVTNTIQSFFRQQAPFIKTIEIVDCIGFNYLNPMRMLLSNLEKVKIRCLVDLDLCLNDLKVLPKLKCLDYESKCSGHAENEFYQLDIAELSALVEVRISAFYSPSDKKLRIVSRNQSLDLMEKFETFGFQLDLASLEQIAQTMPRLKVLTIDNMQKPDAGYDCFGAAAQLNKLVHLESLTEPTQNFLNNDCLENLSLPKLRHLELFASQYGQDKKKTPTSVSQTTLDKLAKNCPKLLRIFGRNLHPRFPNPFIFAQRLNGETKFRKVRPIRKLVDGNRLLFDYDSVESCSSNEE